MTRRFHHRSFVVSYVVPTAVTLALTLGVSGAQAAAGHSDWWTYGPPGAANAVAIQADGKIVAAGAGGGRGDGDFSVSRYTTRGKLDASFGADGRVLTSFGGTDTATAVAIQPGGKIVAAGYHHLSAGYDFALARYTNNGAPDPSFGTGGTVLTDFHSSRDVANAMAIQADGKIVVAGYGAESFALARYTPDGQLDPSFGTGGKVVTSFGSGTKAKAASIALQPNGMIVVAGRIDGRNLHEFALARYTTSGKLDASFGHGGKVVTGFPSTRHSSATGVAIEKNGEIVAVGNARRGKGYYVALARYTRRGHLDPSFGTDGRVLTGWGSPSYAEADAVAIQPDGKIVVAGWTGYVSSAIECDGDGTSFALARYTTGGTLDKSFGKDAKVDKHFGGDNGSWFACGGEWAAAIAIAPDGGIVAAGGLNDEFAIARYSAADTP